MNALFLWNKRYKALSDIDRFFDKIFYKDENQVGNIQNLLDLIQLNNISYVIIQNPYSNEKRLYLYKELKLYGINMLISDRGALPNSWFFDPNGFNADSESYNKKYWDKPLSIEKEKNVVKYIKNEICSDIALELQGTRIGADKLKEKLKIAKDKKVIFVPLQRPSDTVIKYFSGNVDGMEHFLRNIAQIQEKLKDQWVILVKKHPLETQRLFESKLLYVDDDTHFKDLIELSDAVIVINSGVGVSSMMHQKPVLYFGKAFYAHSGINTEVKTVDEAITYLNNNTLKVDFEKVKRFICYLTEDFYSFGHFMTEERVMSDKSKRTITTKINFYQLRGLPKKSNKSTLIVTDIEFWRADIGNRQRILRLIQYLNRHLDLKVLFLKNITQQDIKELESLNLLNIIDKIGDIKIKKKVLKNTVVVNHLENFYNHEIKCRFNKYLLKNNFDNIIVEYIRLDYLVNDLHTNYSTMIDTHDLMSLRTESYEKHNDKHHIVISRDEEYKILKDYNYILSIQKNEFNLLKDNIPENNNLLVYHAVGIEEGHYINAIARNVVFISGPANYKHILWFIENIWKYFLHDKDLTLNIHGSICNNLQQYKNNKNIILHGYAKDLKNLYKHADIVINPILYGGGLKIKNVEALSNGVPLITTDEGANGIEDGIKFAFLLANTIEEWIETILALKLSIELRTKLSKNAIEYSKYYFSDKNCYQKVVEVLKG